MDCLILIGQCIHFGIFQRNWIRIPSKTDRIRNPESSSERYLEVEKLMAVWNKLQVSWEAEYTVHTPYLRSTQKYHIYLVLYCTEGWASLTHRPQVKRV